MGQFWGVLDCTITNNSAYPIVLTKIEIFSGEKTIFEKHYDNQIINPKQSHLEGATGLPAIYSPTVKWTYTYNGIEYTTSKTYQNENIKINWNDLANGHVSCKLYSL